MKYMVKIILAVAFLLFMGACSENEIPGYDSGRSLFFERWKVLSPSSRERIDTVAYSFSHYIGKTELTHYFTVGLIGQLLDEDKAFKIVVVDSLTTATPDQYSLPEHPVFRKGRSTDSLAVVIKKVPSLKDDEVVLTLRLVENDNFGLGYWGFRDVKIRFNDRVVIPLWWTDEVVYAYLGEYSFKKMETIIAANPDFITFEGISATEKRKIALNTKKYIAEHGITEENGDPMEIPIY